MNTNNCSLIRAHSCHSWLILFFSSLAVLASWRLGVHQLSARSSQTSRVQVGRAIHGGAVEEDGLVMVEIGDRFQRVVLREDQARAEAGGELADFFGEREGGGAGAGGAVEDGEGRHAGD